MLVDSLTTPPRSNLFYKFEAARRGMARKGKLQEVMSRALHADDPGLYTVAYRDLDQIREVPLQEFMQLSENFQTIPASRIVYVKRLDEVVYRKAGRSKAG